jgi:hypothetical protein
MDGLGERNRFSLASGGFIRAGKCYGEWLSLIILRIIGGDNLYPGINV